MPKRQPSGQSAGADAEAADGAAPAPGFSALLFAVQGGHLEAASVLADAGASVDDMTPDGSSALVVAIDNRHYELAARLLDPRRRSQRGRRWLDRAPHRGARASAALSGRAGPVAHRQPGQRRAHRGVAGRRGRSECGLPGTRPAGDSDLAPIPHGGSGHRSCWPPLPRTCRSCVCCWPTGPIRASPPPVDRRRFDGGCGGGNLRRTRRRIGGRCA